MTANKQPRTSVMAFSEAEPLFYCKISYVTKNP